MSTTELVEYRIIRNLLQRSPGRGPLSRQRVARLLVLLSLGVGLLLLGLWLQELLWALLAVASMLALGED